MLKKMPAQNTFTFLTIIFSGLVSGLLYSYSCSVNPGLRSLSNIEYLKAMQSINLAIQNPVFFLTFMGLLVIFPVSTYLTYQHSSGISFYLMFTAMIIYFIGVFGVTIFANVPLNEQLASFAINNSDANAISAMRELFEKPWNYYHSIRTAASVFSFSMAVLSLFKIRS